MIVVKDNFFQEDLVNFIAKGIEAYQWSYNHKSDANDPTHNTFFVSNLWANGAANNIFYMIWKQICSEEISDLQDYDCLRIYANGQVKGQDGNWHTDDGDRTVIYFPLEWDRRWGGSTYFKVSGAKEEIQYKRNRLIVFDAAIPHYGSCPTVKNILRVSIAFKLRRKPSEPGELAGRK
jgi:hypothetical protein